MSIPVMTPIEPIRLTQYSHGAGCGCKIAPAVLDKILHGNQTDRNPSETSNPQNPSPSPSPSGRGAKFSGTSPLPNGEGSGEGFWPRLLVGNDTRDDAAVMDLGDGTAVISTTDFFMPIVDDAYDFGRIASANAISDVYAMGGRPIMAIAILGWPIDKLPPEVAAEVLAGSRAVCAEAGIPLAGGHSIDCPEPVFGLAVTGIVKIENLKQNSTARVGNRLYLTKPLGVGILTTAVKKGILRPEHDGLASAQMIRLNSFGAVLGGLPYVTALTDVTGFGLLGHLTEMAEGSGLSAEISFGQVPVLPHLDGYLAQKSIPGGTLRNWDSYGHKIADLPDAQRFVLADPQTSGGLLIAVEAEQAIDFERIAAENGLVLQSFGTLVPQRERVIYVTD